ncbi:MAG: L-serine ammonia-lyase [Aeriscardovia sp.]|nr:L-serine ammonia-lyase [Aeriscardovia sp.]
MLSIFDIYKIGIGPSSSHTLGPMNASLTFLDLLEKTGNFEKTERIHVTLFGSLALTGKGHGTDRALFAGLEGCRAETCDVEEVRIGLKKGLETETLMLGGIKPIRFEEGDIEFDFDQRLDLHPNALFYQAFDGEGRRIAHLIIYSVGGGFIATEEQLEKSGISHPEADGVSIITAKQVLQGASGRGDGFRATEPEEKSAGSFGDLPTGNVAFSCPFEFSTMEDLQKIVKREGKSIAEIVLENEMAVRPSGEIEAKMENVWRTMLTCVSDGIHSKAKELPGVLHVPRRAPGAARQLLKGMADPFTLDPEDLKSLKETVGGNTAASEWVEVFAMAVNEENADGGRIITAPTNGSAGIIPAVLHYMYAFLDGNWEKVKTFFLTSFAVGYLCKKLASISGAEGGCQAEVGSACSMAAAGLCAVFGGSPRQIEKAAEIGIEHNLGLTCDPVAGLVQIPCIERNAIAANTAVNAARLAMIGPEDHIVSLDTALATMKRTGDDMLSEYRETSKGGLAVSVAIPEC